MNTFFASVTQAVCGERYKETDGDGEEEERRSEECGRYEEYRLQ